MGERWPVVPGAYALGDPLAPVAVCTLTDDALYPEAAALPGVAIAGRLNTANLGIEDLLANVTANARLRFLVLCGKDSPLFKSGQSVGALVANGIDEERRIVGAEGHEPRLRNVPPEWIAQFRRQVEVIDRAGVTSLDVIAATVRDLVLRDPGPLPDARVVSAQEERFVKIAPGGRREPLWYDPKGFFVVALDREAGEIVVQHYERDYTPAHEMRGHATEQIVLGLLREELVSQLSHAGYLGAELAKAETALRLGLRYEQDRPLRAS